MKRRSVNIIKTELPVKSAFSIETAPEDLKLHQLCILTAKRGGGKSVSVANIIKHYKQKGYLDRCWVITPTYHSNKEIWDIADITEEDIIDISKDAIKTITDIVENEREEWDTFLKAKALYSQFQKDKHKDFIPDDRIIEYSNFDFFQTKPSWKYKNEVPPRLAVIIDDALNSPVMTAKQGGLINFCLRHRHIGKGLGISVYMLVQSYLAQGGVPKCIRENTTSLLIFKTNDEKILLKIYEELDLEITYEQFKDLLAYCHSKDYNYLLIDFSPKEENMKFRSGYNEFILPKVI